MAGLRPVIAGTGAHVPTRREHPAPRWHQRRVAPHLGRRRRPRPPVPRVGWGGHRIRRRVRRDRPHPTGHGSAHAPLPPEDRPLRRRPHPRPQRGAAPVVIVVTCLLTAQPDPQRHTTLPADPGLLDTLRSSVTSKGFELHVLADCPLTISDPLVIVHLVPPGGNPYFHRWAVIADFLDGLGGWVWCVAGTDTELLAPPAPTSDVLHIGSEPLTVGCPWMRATNPSLAPWIDRHPDLPLLNPGITGGPAPV